MRVAGVGKKIQNKINTHRIMNIGQRERNNISCLGWPVNKGLREFLFRSSAVSFLPVRLYYMYKVPLLLLTMKLCIRLSWTFENHRYDCQFDGN